MSPQNRTFAASRIRRPFHALPHSNAGLGIGLAVVRELVEAHGGSVVAQSAGRGLGSEFTVTLPYNACADH